MGIELSQRVARDPLGRMVLLDRTYEHIGINEDFHLAVGIKVLTAERLVGNGSSFAEIVCPLFKLLRPLVSAET